MKHTKTIISFIQSILLLAGCSSDKISTIVTVEGGQVQGVETDIPGVYVYKGIPYAAPPVGDLRWKEPQPVIPWEGVKVADTYGPGAFQAPHTSANPWTSEFYMHDPEFSEDCLYLNVFTKAPGNAKAKLPVAMWIHGGAYTGGWGYEIEFDGKNWANKDVVLVTINYRLGMFGFMVDPLLTAESEHGVSGNYGILDQIAALKWIRNNIEQFGGDPDNITIFGQSAGAGSVKTLVASPLTEGLISKAIIQSGGGVSENPVHQENALERVGANTRKIMEWAGYDTLEKMRAASTEEIYSVPSRYAEETGDRQTRFQTSPVIDGYVSTEGFDYAATQGAIKDIPYMIGFTMNDMSVNPAAIERFCALREKTDQSVYAYEFARKLPDNAEGTHDMKGAFHSSELWFMFDSIANSDRPMTEGDFQLAELMSDCWTNFVKTGNPGHGWESFSSQKPEFMIFNLGEDGNVDAKMGPAVLE